MPKREKRADEEILINYSNFHCEFYQNVKFLIFITIPKPSISKFFSINPTFSKVPRTFRGFPDGFPISMIIPGFACFHGSSGTLYDINHMI